MRQVSLLLLTAVLMCAQNGQQESRSGWPCVSGRAVDPAYLETSESTGGQVFLFQKEEVAMSAPALMASTTHPATISRATGHVAGTRDFEFTVDSTIDSILVLASLQCRKTVEIFRPDGQEMTSVNSTQNIDLKTGKILRVDFPEPGVWKLRISGTGLYVFSVMAKTAVKLTNIRLPNPRIGERQDVEARVTGEISSVRTQLVTAAGEPMSEPDSAEELTGGAWRIAITPRADRFRLRVLATDANGRPLERMWPVLFRAHP